MSKYTFEYAKQLKRMYEEDGLSYKEISFKEKLPYSSTVYLIKKAGGMTRDEWVGGRKTKDSFSADFNDIISGKW